MAWSDVELQRLVVQAPRSPKNSNFFLIILKFATFKNIIRKYKKADFAYKYFKIAFKISFLTTWVHSKWPDQMLNCDLYSLNIIFIAQNPFRIKIESFLFCRICLKIAFLKICTKNHDFLGARDLNLGPGSGSSHSAGHWAIGTMAHFCNSKINFR